MREILGGVKNSSGVGWQKGWGSRLLERAARSPRLWPLCRVNDVTNMFFKDHTVIHGFH